MKIASIFPGQGAQKIGMGYEVYKRFKSARLVFEEADDILQYKLSQIIFEGPTEKLTLTENTQVALMVCSIAFLKVLEEKIGKQLKTFCSYVAGHSLGEFTALVANGTLSFQECVKLLNTRGKAMQEAAPLNEGAMFALLGADITTAKQIAQEAKVAVANDNAPTQQVLSGNTSAIQKAMQLAQEKGYKSIKLNVSGPFHCNLMKPAQVTLEQALTQIELSTPQIPIISNFTAEIMPLKDIKNNLLLQLTNTVKWCDSIKNLKKLGVDTILEIGPGTIYTNLTRKIDMTFNAISLNDEATINVFVEQLVATIL
ncbi:MAG: ACP S-malonyltransferase [Rickettsiales bacterium]|nr:ACP S-malonyltransferase [Rickettsiales bacterium]